MVVGVSNEVAHPCTCVYGDMIFKNSKHILTTFGKHQVKLARKLKLLEVEGFM